ncbi:MAG: sugar transferase [Syntrophales bacterium LBB04]|nr:sugar transferase [Syntrophales bacterium LBB04]
MLASQTLRFSSGMTGLWQVKGRTGLLREMIRLDISYTQNLSLWLDLKILLMTPLAIIRYLANQLILLTTASVHKNDPEPKRSTAG